MLPLYLLPVVHRPVEEVDAGSYVVLGRSLAAGTGYRMISDPDRPWHRQYPPGLPLLLAGVVRLSGAEAYGAMRLLIGGCGVAAAWIWWRWLARQVEAPVAWAVAAVSGLLPVIVEQSHLVLSEVPYLAASLLALVLLDRFITQPSPSRVLFLAAAAGVVAAYMLRSVGVVLLVAAAVAWMLRRLRRQPSPSAFRMVSWLGVVLVPLLLWTVRTVAAGQQLGSDYVGDLLLVNPAYPHLGSLGLAGWLERMGRHGAGYAVHLGWALVFDNRPLASWQWAVSLVAAALVVVGWWRRAQRDGSVWEWYLAGYVVAIAAWSWVAPRMVVPILPLAVWYGLLACEMVYRVAARSASARSVQRMWLVVCAVWVVASAPRAVERAVSFQQPRSGEATRAMWKWMATATPEDAVVATPGPALLFLQTGRRSVELPRLRDADRFFAALDARGVRYVVVDPGWEPMAWYALEAMRSVPDRLTVRQRFGNVLCLELLPRRCQFNW